MNSKMAGLFCLLGIFIFFAADSSGYSAPSSKPSVMVATAHPLATRAGISILKAGGNAIDAAVAIQTVLNVIEPQSSGIGGGCFLLYYHQASNEVVAIDGREEAPRQAYPEMFLDADGKEIPFYPDRITGGRSVGVPGCLRALHKAWQKYGSGQISWDRLFESAVNLAERGFPISGRLAEAIQGEAGRLKLFPASREIFFDAAGEPKRKGEVLIQKDLARTLQLIAKGGPSVFYQGEIAQDIVKAVREAPQAPGWMSVDDLREYEAPLRKPVVGTYRGFQIYSMPPPSSGGTTLIEALNILELFPIAQMGPERARFIHLFSEAQKLAFANRNRYLGDSDFVEVPVADLISKEWASSRSVAIHPHRAFAGKAKAMILIELGNTSTSHISMVDQQGNMLAMTTTIEHIFGSAMVVPGRGFILNNELTDFDASPYLEGNREILAPNRVEGGRRKRRTSLDIPASLGGKRPLSSMSPTLLFKEGKPYASLGSPGGTQIIGIVLNLIVNLVDFKMSVAKATAWPRIINRNGPLELERDFFQNKKLMDRLKKMGHEVVIREPFGNAQGVMIHPETGELSGASDPRGEGGSEGI